ncbi:hypothetical protein [Defluviimonas salinarum]|uniref:hypothetical protein n=1 Tax=Defluviimonas salinarum TaxID=2992147 RepID=UPI0022301D8B|nr:hypothetical protein [Defluviimonas salinarum]
MALVGMGAHFSATAVVVCFLLLITRSADAQSVDDATAQIISIMEETNANLEAQAAQMEAERQQLTNTLSQIGCDCSAELGGCEADVTVESGNAQSLLRITTDKSCARVSFYLTTTWDREHGTPVNEQISIIQGGVEEEWIDHDMWNGRKPILERPATCKTCSDGATAYCELSNRLLSRYSGVTEVNRKAAADMDEPIKAMKSGGLPERMVSATIRQKEILERIAVTTEAIVDEAQKGQIERCN